MAFFSFFFENEPVFLGNWGTSGRDGGGFDFSGFVFTDTLGRNLGFWDRWGSWQLEGLDSGFQVLRRQCLWLELFDVLDVQVRNQVVSSWGDREESLCR